MRDVDGEAVCQYCGRPLDAAPGARQAVESGAASGYTCDGCFGLEELPEDLEDCHYQDCDEPAPFRIKTTHNEVRRCRPHLLADLDDGMWEFITQNTQ